MELFDQTAIVLPFLPDAKQEISCILTWDSEIAVALRGNEGRSAFRSAPRPKLVFTAQTTSSAQTADLRARLIAGGDLTGPSGGRLRFAAPWQARGCWLTADVPAGATTLPLAATPWPWRNADGWIAFPDPRSGAVGSGWTYGRTTGIGAGYVLGLSAPLAVALPAGAVVFPLFVGRLDADRAPTITAERLRQPLTLYGDSQFIDTTLPMACLPPGGSTLQNFDFAIVRYQWGPTNGRDLDTRTALIVPTVGGDVGWSRGSQVVAGDGTVLLQWGGDNTTPTGAEAVLISFPAIVAAYPAAATITIRLRANWYGERYDGSFNLQFATYLGGTMQGPNSFDFVNVGGAAVQVLNTARNVTSNVAANVDGQDVGTLVYTVATKSAVIIPAA